MAVRPIKIMGDTVEVWHDEGQHGGRVTLHTLAFGAAPNGSEDLRYLHIPCPVPGCDSHSVHPASGGCDPESVQRLFVKRLMLHPKHAGKPAARAFADAQAEHQALVEAEGPNRYRLVEYTQV